MTQHQESFQFFFTSLSILFLVGFKAMGWSFRQAAEAMLLLVIASAVVYVFAVLVCTL